MPYRKMIAFFLPALLAPAVAGAANLRAGLYRYDGGVGLYTLLDGQHVICDNCRQPPILPGAPPMLAASIGEEPAAQIVVEAPTETIETVNGATVQAPSEEPLVTVYFLFNDAALSQEEKCRIRQAVLDHPGPVTVRVAGHACRIGTHDYNKDLSMRRAKAVATYLRFLGLQVASIEGFGDARSLGGPLAKDRRSEILIKERMLLHETR